MIGGGGGGAGTAAESAAAGTAVVLLISSFRSFQEATLPAAAKPSAQAERRAPMLAIVVFSREFHRCYSKVWTSKSTPKVAGERWRSSASLKKLVRGQAAG